MRAAGPHVEHTIAVRHGGTSGYLSLGAAFLNGTPGTTDSLSRTCTGLIYEREATTLRIRRANRV